MDSKQKAPVPIMVTRAKLSVATSRLNALIESFHASIEQKSFNLVEQHQKDVVTQLATVEELTYSMIASADESEHANLVQKLTTFCIESDELRAKALELSETRKRVPNPFQVTFTGDSTLNADHCTNQGTQGTFQSYTTTACQDPVQFLDNPDTTHSELSNRGDHSQQPTGFQPRPAVVEVHAASLPSANAASFSSAYQSAAPEIPTVSVPSIGNLGVSQRNDSQFYLYRNALPKINLDTFDGDPTKWTDWNSRFQFMIGQAPLSSSQKIAYLQGLVEGRAKSHTIFWM